MSISSPSIESQAPAPAGKAAAPPLSDAALEGRHTWIISRAKLKIAYNALRHIKRHVYLHAFVGIGMMLFIVGGGTALFSFIFNFMMTSDELEVFGPPLMDRLVSIVFLIFFSMLLFSNLIITLSTTYISREVEFLMGLPVSRQSVFRQKLLESILYSSWAFALLSFPIFVSYGITRAAPWYYYPLIIGMILPFLFIPASLGAIITMVLTSFLPARKTRTLCIALGILSIVAMLLLSRYSGLSTLISTADRQDFLQIMDALGFGSSAMLPSAWLSSALVAIAPPNPIDRDLGAFAYWFSMLLATGLFFMEVTRWLVSPLYYRGWCLSRDAAVREVESNARFSPFRVIDRWLNRAFAAPTAGLLSKDLKTFWRDPSQWTQLVILFGLMIIYIMNLGWSTRYSATMELVINDWKAMLTFFNLAASCFILSILTTRFVYPMLSLEGRGFWTVGLAPIPRQRIVWQKYILCLLLCIGVSVPLVILSGVILRVDLAFTLVSIATVVVMSAGLTSLSVGIGAILPDFKEDNPARIANGVGGTLNVLLSLAYIGVSVVLLAAATSLLAGAPSMRPALVYGVPFALGFVIIQVAAIVLPMRIGLNRWIRMEF